MRMAQVMLPVTVGAVLTGCTFPRVEELSTDDLIRQRFGTTHNITVNAPNINDPNSGSARAMALALKACNLPQGTSPKDVNLQLSQAFGAARLFNISCPVSGKDIQ